MSSDRLDKILLTFLAGALFDGEEEDALLDMDI